MSERDLSSPWSALKAAASERELSSPWPALKAAASERELSSPWSALKAAAALLLIAGLVHPDAFAQSALSTSGAEAGPAAGMPSNAYFPLLVAQSIWLVLVGVGAPLLSRWSARAREGELRGLNLPRGSIRAMLALLVVGTLMNFLVFGGSAFDGEVFGRILAVLAGLTGAVIALCFRGRSAALAPLDPSCGDSE